MPSDLRGQVALVTGGSRGVGRGVAMALSRAGATTLATGRSIGDHPIPRVTCLPCDHTQDAEVDSVFRAIASSAGRLDVLVNVAWGGYERMVEDGQFTYIAPFWEQPLWRWDAMMTTGVRGAFVASQHAARLMVAARRGLIVNISFWAAQKYLGNSLYGISKAATDKMTRDMAHELKPYGVTVLSLYPGLVRTEAVLAANVFDLSNSESPEFIGRVIAAMAADPDIAGRTGTVCVAAAVAQEYDVKDTDGSRPRALSLADV